MKISMAGVLSFFLRGVVRLYQFTISPVLGPRCRYLPTCSDFALEAIGSHGPLACLWLTAGRIARCHPWGGSGLDPVPECPGDKTCGHRHDQATTTTRTFS